MHTSTPRRWLTAAALIAVLGLAACAGSGNDGEPGYDRSSPFHRSMTP